MLSRLVRVEECCQMRGGVLPAVAGFLQPIYAIFTQGSFAPGFKMGWTQGGGDGLEVEFRILGGGLQRFEEVGDGLEMSQRLARGEGVVEFAVFNRKTPGMGHLTMFGLSRTMVVRIQDDLQSKIVGFYARKTAQGFWG